MTAAAAGGLHSRHQTRGPTSTLGPACPSSCRVTEVTSAAYDVRHIACLMMCQSTRGGDIRV